MDFGESCKWRYHMKQHGEQKDNDWRMLKVPRPRRTRYRGNVLASLRLRLGELRSKVFDVARPVENLRLKNSRSWAITGMLQSRMARTLVGRWCPSRISIRWKRRYWGRRCTRRLARYLLRLVLVTTSGSTRSRSSRTTRLSRGSYVCR